MLEKILKIAVLGTEKTFFSEEDQENLNNWKIPLNDSPEKIFLQTALVYTKMQQAGYQPAKGESQLPSAAPESRQAIGEKSNFQLGLMLSGSHNQILPEFLQIVDQQNKRISHRYLPDILDWGVAKQELHHTLIGVLGERGKWLAQLNSQWEYLLDIIDPKEIDWETASFTDRKAHLRKIRKTDPQKGIELLEKTWDEEDSNHKSSFLKILGESLDSQDEEFLEKARTDRRKDVRTQAFQLLAKIPSSKYDQQIRTYLDQHIAIKGNLIKKSVDVQLPSSFGEQLKNLGVYEKLTVTKGGQKANWLAQIISRVHPDYWVKKFQKKPDEIITLIQKSEWNELLISTISQAAIFYQEQEWLCAFFDKTHNKQSLNLAELVYHIEEESFNQLVEKQIKSGLEALYHNKPLFLLLEYSQVNLNDQNALEIIKLYQELVRKEHRKSSYYQWQTKNLLKKLGQRINPYLLPEIREGWTENLENGDHWFANITEFLRLLEFRKEIREAL